MLEGINIVLTEIADADDEPTEMNTHAIRLLLLAAAKFADLVER
jgi:hypothetical protein